MRTSGGITRPIAARQNGIPAISRGVALLWCLCIPLPSHAQTGAFSTPAFAGSAAPAQGPLSTAAASPPASSAAIGTAVFEILPGNGTGAGYALSHGNVVASSVMARSGAGALRLGVDFFLTAADGSLYFCQPISRFDSVSVSYRYLDGPVTGQADALPQTRLDFGGGGSLGLLYMSTPGAGAGLTGRLFGLDMRSGAGQRTSYSGMAYFSSVQRNQNISFALTQGQQSPVTAATAPQSDHLIVQNLGLHAGGLSMTAALQDVGAKFSGFDALKQGAAGDKAALDQIQQLQANAGVQKLGFGLGYALDPKRTGSSGLSLDWGQTRAAASGLKSTSIDIGLKLAAARGSGGLALGLSDQRFGDASGGLTRDALSLAAGGLNLSLISQRADPTIQHLGSIADADKAALAFDIRRLYDPLATMQQVTQKDKDQIADDAGITRSGAAAVINLGKKAGTLTVADATVAATQPLQVAGAAAPPPTGGVQREAIAYVGKTLQVNLLQQTIDNGFTQTTSLSDYEKSQLGNEHGLRRQQLTILFMLNKLTKVQFSTLDIGATPQALAAATTAALSSGADPQTVNRLAAAYLRRESFSVQTKNASFAYNLSDTSKGFNRGPDLAMAAADQAAIEAEMGFRRADLTAHIAGVKGLTLDATQYDASDAFDHLGHDRYKDAIAYAPSKLFNLSVSADGDVATTNGEANGLTHGQFSLTDLFAHGLGFILSGTQATQVANGALVQQTNDLHFETPKALPESVIVDDSQVNYAAGKYTDTLNLNVHAKPSKDLTLDASNSTVNSDPSDPSAQTDSFDVQWQATKKIAVTGGVSETAATSADANAGNAVSVGVQGQPVQNVTLAAKVDEVHTDGVDTKDVADFAVSNGKPITFGPVKDLTISAHYGSLNDQRKLQNEAMTGHATWSVWKNQFLLDYSGQTKPDGTSTILRTYSVATDPNPKKWVHASFFYKDRSLPTGQEQLTRKFAADARLTQETTFNYLFTTLPEDAKGVVQPTETITVGLNQNLKHGTTAQWFYNVSDNYTTQIMTRSLGLGFLHKVSENNSFELAISTDANGFADRYDHSDHLHLGFTHKLDADHFLTLSTELRSHDQQGLEGQVQTNLQFRSVF